MPHQLFLTTRQRIKIRNTFANIFSTDKKLSETKISKIIQSGGSFGSWLIYAKKLTNNAIPLGIENLPGLVTNSNSKVIKTFKWKISEKGAVRPGKRFCIVLLTSIQSLEDLDVFIDGVIEIVKIKMNKIRQIFWSFVNTFSQFISATCNFFSSKTDK